MLSTLRLLRVSIVAALVFASACTTQVYEGAPRPDADISVLSLLRSEPNITFGAVVLDGKSLSSTRYGFSTDFHILPGSHTLSFTYRIDADAYCDVREHLCPAVVVTGHCSGSFTSEAGKGYVAELVNRGANLSAAIRRAREYNDLLGSTGSPLAELSCEPTGRGPGLEAQK